MSELIFIRHASPAVASPGREIRLVTDRATLAKRRWRGKAEDGREFGFDLDHALSPGTCFYKEADRHYVLGQAPEEVLEIAVASVEQAARIGWSLGNLHFGVQILAAAVRVQEDPAVLQLLEREKIAHQRVTCVFLPLTAGGHHHHDHE